MINYTRKQLNEIAIKYFNGPLSKYVDLELFDDDHNFSYEIYHNLDPYIKDLLDTIPINLITSTGSYNLLDVYDNSIPLLDVLKHAYTSQETIPIKKPYIVSNINLEKHCSILNITKNIYNYFPIYDLNEYDIDITDRFFKSTYHLNINSTTYSGGVLQFTPGIFLTHVNVKNTIEQ